MEHHFHQRWLQTGTKDAWDTSVLVESKVGDRIETVRFFHCYKRGVDRVFVDHPMFLEKVWGKTGSKLCGPRTGVDYKDNQLRFSLLCQAQYSAKLRTKAATTRLSFDQHCRFRDQD